MSTHLGKISFLDLPDVNGQDVALKIDNKVLQVVTGTIGPSSGTTQVPLDNTVPTDTEGFQIWSRSFTPLSASSTIIISFTLTVSHATAGRTFTTSVFAGSTNIGAACVSTAITTSFGGAVQAANTMSLQVAYAPGSTATITFSARTGTNGSGTAYVNQTSGATMGGSLVTEYTIMEVI